MNCIHVFLCKQDGSGVFIRPVKMWRKFHMQRTTLEITRFAICITSPVLLMFYIGHYTHDKLNVPDFWPDPNRLNQIPKDRVELKKEIERLRQERLARKQAKLEAAKAESE